MMGDSSLRYDVERAERWRVWVERVPPIKFPRGWEIKIIPPFAGAMARFIVNGSTSVYLDVDNALGYYDGPYWEVHPVDGDVHRVDMDDVDGLLKAIRKSLRQCRATTGAG